MLSGKGGASSEHSPGRARIQQLSDKLTSLPYAGKEDARCVGQTNAVEETVGRAETPQLRRET